MGCGCKNHGASRSESNNVFAQDQCYFCGMKHLTIAWTLYNEFGYEDLNLAAVDGQLRLAVMHLQYIERDYCNKLRDISVAIEERKLDVVTNEKFKEAMNELQEKIYKEFPDIKQKYTDLKKNK